MCSSDLKYNLALIEIYSKDLYPIKYLDNKLRDKFKDVILMSNVGDARLELALSCPRDRRVNQLR